MHLTKIRRSQLLAVTDWAETDLTNRTHGNQVALAHGLTLPVENGTYIGLDCVALILSDKLAEGGFARGVAARFVRDFYGKWLTGLARIEWPDLHPAAASTVWTPTQPGDKGVTALAPDTEIYFTIAKTAAGDFHVACGTMFDIFSELVALMTVAPVQITQVNLRAVYETTLAAARRAKVDLGAPFTRPAAHPEHRDWDIAVEVHRALSFARMKKRNPPGPRAKARARRERKRNAASADASA